MRMWAAAWLFTLSACGPARQPPVLEGSGGASVPDDAAPTRAPVPCGAQTCGPDEYCESRCTCCGMRVPDPSEASGVQRCLPLPDSCKTGNGPECQQREVDVPCA